MTNPNLYPGFQHHLDAPNAERTRVIDTLHPLSYPKYEEFLGKFKDSSTIRHTTVRPAI